jgi:hypothetical protein
MAVKSIAIGIFLLLIIFTAGVYAATERPSEDALTVTADFAYRCREGDLRPEARALALFGARLRAVNLAAKYLTHKGLLEHAIRPGGRLAPAILWPSAMVSGSIPGYG